MVVRCAKDLDRKGLYMEDSEMGFKILGVSKLEKSRRMNFRSRVKLWLVRALTILLLWTSVVQLIALGKTWGPKLLRSLPHCSSTHIIDIHSAETSSTAPIKVAYPPKRVYRNSGYLIVSCNGGLNQMRAAICDMVAIARDLNATLIVPELDKTSFWHDSSDFEDIFDVDHFIKSLRDEVRILKELPPRMKRRVELGKFYSLQPVSWSHISYYENQILPLVRNYKVVHLNKTDTRLANNRLSPEIQKLRCRVNFNALRFTPRIEELGRKIVRILRQKGPFLVLHLRYEMDMLSFSGYTRGCNNTEMKELTSMRYANHLWKEKVIDSDLKRQQGLCPMTPEETALVLTGLGIDRKVQIYIAAGEPYGGDRRMKNLLAAFPNVVRKENLLDPSDLWYFHNHSSQKAALDYLVSLESDIFLPTYDGNMARVVEGHRRFMGFKKTIQLDRKNLVNLIVKYTNGSLSWDEFSSNVKDAHANRMGSPKRRIVIPDKPKEEDYFYSNPQECLQLLDEPLGSK